MDKTDRERVYASLVGARKTCHACKGLVNPAELRWDSDQIGPWSLWQGNLQAELMVVGQDWGDRQFFDRNKGHDPSGNPTNRTLRELLGHIGLDIAPPSSRDLGGGVIFLTNAILCLKDGGLQAKTMPEWFENCGKRFLRATIDLIEPQVLVSLGESAYGAITSLYGIRRLKFKDAVDAKVGFTINGLTRYFPTYHCGARILNTHRPLENQLRDWERGGKALHRSDSASTRCGVR